MEVETMSKLRLIFLALLVGIFFLMSACSNQNSTKNEEGQKEFPGELRIGYQVIPNAELLAKSLQLVEKEFEGTGTKINWIQFESARDVNTAITSNSIDVGLIGSSSVSTGISQKLPYEVVWIHDVIGDNEALVGKGFKTINEVVGKKIAVPFGSTTHYSFLSALDINGINQSDVTILDMQPQDMAAAWKQGQIDGGYVWFPILGEMLKDGEIILTSRELAGKGIITADIGVARKEFTEQFPRAVEKYITALDTSVKFYRSNESEAAKSMAKELNVTEKEASEYMSQLIWLDASEQSSKVYLGTTDEKGSMADALQKTAEFMVTQKAIESAPETEKFQEGINAEFINNIAKK
jgi:taurine transport system substrate-binding protein